MSDLIDREEAIKAVYDKDIGMLTQWDIGRNAGIDYAIKQLEKLPSAQPEQRWIPCSERLPDDLAEVNVTWVNHDPEPYYGFAKNKPFTASAVYYEGKWYWYSSVCADVLGEYGRNDVDAVDDTIEITAWQPLPEPYKGETT